MGEKNRRRDDVQPAGPLQWDGKDVSGALAQPAPGNFDSWWQDQIAANGGINIGADYRHWAEQGYCAALKQPSAGVQAKSPHCQHKGCTGCVDADDRANAATAAQQKALYADALSVMLWLYRRLPRSFGPLPHVEGPIMAIAKQVSVDVDGFLAERREPPVKMTGIAIDTCAALTPEQLERAQAGFEAWAQARKFNIQRASTSYATVATCYVWMGWLAAVEQVAMTATAEENS